MARIDNHQLSSGGDMARFFFHLQDGSTFLDDEGTELSDPNAARLEAIRVCGEMLREVPQSVSNGGPFRLWVTDGPHGRGETVFTLTVAAQTE
jgi:hypothetical protein